MDLLEILDNIDSYKDKYGSSQLEEACIRMFQLGISYDTVKNFTREELPLETRVYMSDEKGNKMPLTNEAIKWLNILKQQHKGDLPYYCFVEYASGLPLYAFVTVSEDEEYWCDERYDGEIIFAWVGSERTFGSIEGGSIYVVNDDGKIKRITLQEKMQRMGITSLF